MERPRDEAGSDRVRSLLEQHRAPLLNRIRLIMGREARRTAGSGDFLHEVVVEILQKTERWDARDDHDFLRRATWLARNRTADHVRRKREAAFADFSKSGVIPRSPACTDTPSRDSASAEDQERLIEALESLSQDHQRIIVLRDFESMSFPQIGAELGRSEHAAQRLHKRAIVKLGAALRRGGGTP